ncbi:glycosyltransferase family 2 protein [Leeuwenhoekiella sp. A16]|uniref:glycosyltransferase family 2 protein n=1 Tax=Leeuwenhoekiella sp. A16 TaxID=3141462 RepID=UPI003A80F88A
MKLSLIICTYQRPEALRKLLDSVVLQTAIPDEIIIVDGSRDDLTGKMIEEVAIDNLNYFRVSEKDRGLTKQRNFGIEKTDFDTEIIAFLDDDVILKPDYFKQLLLGYQLHPEALGVGGYILEDIKWRKVAKEYKAEDNEFCYDGFCRPDGSRYVLRKKLGLDADRPPAHFPEFGHGRSVSFLPPSRKIYEVEQLMGGVSSFKKIVFETHKFSEYFEGYGLYEDADFTLRVSKTGKLFVNTNAQLYHHHEESGRPDLYKYGKMVIRNGWYVWRVKFPNPSLKNRLKWHATAGVLTFIRLTNAMTSSHKKHAFSEAKGRISGWFSLIFNAPRIK